MLTRVVNCTGAVLPCVVDRVNGTVTVLLVETVECELLEDGLLVMCEGVKIVTCVACVLFIACVDFSVVVFSI